MKNIILALFLAVFSTACYANTQVPANLVTSSTSAFAHCLTISDTNVQQALNDIDACFASASALAWGNITGTLSNQSDLQAALNGKYSTSNPSSYISNITGLLSNGTNVTITGSGTVASPYVVSSSGGASLSANQTFTGNNWFNNNNTVIGNGAGAATVLDTLTVQTGSSVSGLTINGTASGSGVDSNALTMLSFNNNTTDTSSNAVTVSSANLSFSNSSPQFAGTYYGIWDGSSTNVSVPDASYLNFGTNNFTIEFWVNLTSWPSASREYGLVTKGGGGNVTYDINVTTGGSGDHHLSGFAYSGGYIGNCANNINATISLGTWYHIAYVRNGSNFNLYVNGVSIGSATTSAALPSSSTYKMYIGDEGEDNTFDSSSVLPGEIQGLRISNIARWTTNFTPPTVPYSVSQSIPCVTLAGNGSALSQVCTNSYTGVSTISNGGVTALSISNTGATTLATGSGVTGGATGTGATSCLCKTFSNGICTVIGTCT